MLRRRTLPARRGWMNHCAFMSVLAAIPLLAACGGSSGGHALAVAVTTPPAESKGVAMGEKPTKVETQSAPAAKDSHGKGVGKQAKLPRRKVCRPGKAKHHVACT